MTHPNGQKKKQQHLRLVLPDAHSTECLREKWSMESLPPESLALTLWDSFEWGVWFGGHILYSQGKVYRLCSRSDGWFKETVGEEKAEGRPRFWRDFKDVRMRESLEGMLGLRGLMPVARGVLSRQTWILRNKKGKIVSRLECVTAVSGPRGEGKPAHYCRIITTPGHEAHAAGVTKRLVASGAVASDAGPLELLLKDAGNVPRPYTLRPSFGLRFETPARESLGRIVLPMLEIAERNLPGILDDVDTEFLHDYRVCLRKVRSLLGLVKGVYAPEETAAIREVLGNLARRTNELRDIDVYLMAREEHLLSLPPVLRPALERTFIDFQAARVKELRRTRAHLRAEPTRLLLREVKAFFAAETAHGPAQSAESPLGSLVFARIRKAYEKIRRLAAQIQADTPDDKMHELRIAGKKLRYLLEFFSELVPEDRLSPLLKSLRQLQNCLGEFNDASVQQRNLLAYWHRKGGQPDAAMALGGLIAILHDRQNRSRRQIVETLEEFCGESTRTAFKRLFKEKRAGRP